MDQVSSKSGLGSDVTDETTSMGDGRWSSEEEGSDPQGQCLAVPQAPPPSYKQRLEEFKKLFKELPEAELLIVDYPCALQRDILLQGRLYLSENWLCFYSNVFRGTKILLTLRDICAMSREKTARLIPNAIQISTETEKGEKLPGCFPYVAKHIDGQGFRFLGNETQTSPQQLTIEGKGKFNDLFKPLTSLELWQMVKQHYGNDLGLNYEEMESLQVAADTTTQASLATRPGPEDNSGHFERTPSLRLPSVEQGPIETSTPQGGDMSSLLSPQSINSSVTEDVRNTSTQRCSPSPQLQRSVLGRVSKRSSLSLDLNANTDRFSEQSGSESAEDEERVGLSQVHGRLYLNKVFHISAEKMFELLFTDSYFIRRFMKVRKITNATFNPWQRDASGSMKRILNYTITINNPLIGKFSTATENQILYKDSREGQYYLVDAEVYTHDVPYHDYFYTQNRFCIIRHSKRKCRLRVYTDVKYKKQPWGLIKSFITKNSWSGIEEYFRHLEMELLEEEAEMNQGGGDSGKMSGLRRRRRTYSRTLQEHMKPNLQYGPETEQQRDMDPLDMKGTNRLNITTIVAGMSVILLILTVLNLGLFFKLWAMEDVAHRMYLSTKHKLRERNDPSLAPDYGARQGPLHRTPEETHLFKAVLQDSINLLEQLRSSLMVLQKNFAMVNQTATLQ